MNDVKKRLEARQPLWEEWNLDERIFGGCSSEVYKLRHESTEEYCALKVITILLEREPGANRDQKLKSLTEKRERAKNEIEAMYKLNSCPYTVHCLDHEIKDIYDDKGRLAGFDALIRMDYYECLSKRLYEGDFAMSEDEIIKIGLQVGEGVKAAHALDIIHRDIKPQNIFINDRGDYLLGDFGISRQAETGYYSTIAGTPEFIAPEVYYATAEEKYEKSADIYSLGLVMYTILNNNYIPFTDENTPQHGISEAILKRVNGAELPKLDSVSEALMVFLLRCCQYHAYERYQTIEEFITKLTAVSNGETAESFEQLKDGFSTDHRKSQLDESRERYLDNAINYYNHIGVKKYVITVVVMLVFLFLISDFAFADLLGMLDIIVYVISGATGLLTSLALREKNQPLTILNMLSDTICPFSGIIFVRSFFSPTLFCNVIGTISVAVILTAYFAYWRQKERSVRKALFSIKTILCYAPLVSLIFIM